MKNPGTAYDRDRQPDHMDRFQELPYSDDNGGVHINSGIPNKAFYLVSMKIGTDTAAFLWYNAWKDTSFIRHNAQFNDAFECILHWAEKLSKQGSIPAESVDAVKSAFRQVGIYSLVGGIKLMTNNGAAGQRSFVNY